VGLQLVGPQFSEPLLLAMVEAYQRETGHHLARPPARSSAGGTAGLDGARLPA
jgi:hypothetical protein